MRWHHKPRARYHAGIVKSPNKVARGLAHVRNDPECAECPKKSERASAFCEEVVDRRNLWDKCMCTPSELLKNGVSPREAILIATADTELKANIF